MAGDVQDIAVVGDARYVLTTTKLYRAVGSGAFVAIANTPKQRPFSGDDLFCSAPLVAYGDNLFAGSSTDGRLYKIAPAP